jgi:hypothetical protein
MDTYDHARLTQAYNSSLASFTPASIVRFQRLLDALDRVQPETYGLLLVDMIDEDRLENFQTLFPLICFSDEHPYDVYLMMRCAGDKAPFAEVIYAQGFDARRFIDEMEVVMESYDDPNTVIDVIEWLADRDRAIRSQKEAIYNELIFVTLENFEVGVEERVQVIRRLVHLGAVVDDYLIRECTLAFPENVELQEFLRDLCILPDIRGQDCS